MDFRTLRHSLLVCLLSPTLGVGQTSLTTPPSQYFEAPPASSDPELTVQGTLFRILRDQKQIWTGPARLKTRDLRWILPLGATTGLLLATDSHSVSRIHSNPANRKDSSNLSDAGLFAFAGAAGFSFVAGTAFHNPHARETGLLMGESMADAFLVTEAVKLITQRDRPDIHGGAGDFWREPSWNSSFPSQHSALAWSAATVLAHEYPGPLTQWASYGLASAVSIARVTAEKHFPSDVLVGAAAGYLIGRYVYKTNHREDRRPVRINTRLEPLLAELAGPREPTKAPLGSVYVPLDSWIYPALRRLGDFGLIPNQPSNVAPWTRAECLAQVRQAAERLHGPDGERLQSSSGPIAAKLVSDLSTELEAASDSDNMIRLESVYTRFTGISGRPLRDSYHFGQTIRNDFGRPYDQGFNNVTGFSAYAISGRLSVYFRGEYQNAPGRSSESPTVRDFIGRTDQVPFPGGGSVASTNRFQPLEMYIGARFGLENITFGKQNLWWGPGSDSAFSFTNNAEPFYQLRFAQVEPLVLPGFLHYLGKIRTDIVFGKLSGHRFPARPYVTAQKISLAVTDDLEIGFTRSSFFGGVGYPATFGGHPLTFGTLKETLFGTESIDKGPNRRNSDLAGDRHSGFDFRWRVPGLQHRVTLYSDSYADDDPNPLDNPPRAAWAPGIYFSHLPKLEAMDFRFETYSTWLYAGDLGGNFIYWNNQYRDAYTNKGYLLGSSIGRDARAYFAETNCWSSAKTKITASYRQIKAGPAFLPGGGTQTDVSLGGTWGRQDRWLLNAKLQGERYNIPLLGSPLNNYLVSFGMVYTPRNAIIKQ